MKTIFTVAALALALQFANAQTTPTKTAPATTPAKTTTATPPAKPAAPATATAPATEEAPKFAPGTEPAFTWSEETWDFGTIPQGTPVTHEFKFTNSGKNPLVISKVDKSCGCTTPKWITEPVLPGKQGFVSATFNAAAPGGFNKTVTVHSNAGDKVLHIKGTVQPKETPATATPAGDGH